MRTDLRVPFAEKDEAKRLGARWDPARKVWYVQNQADLAPFSRWLPTGSAPSDAGAPGKAPAAKKPQKSGGGTVVVGSKYVEQPRVCDCLPWEVCDKCRSMALSG
ncbi:MAG: hypothetical protein H6R10_2888 [Rhodocyclaceae bacterium]|nr:hypothetical protein [Rhodocyclaceae bacterium]